MPEAINSSKIEITKKHFFLYINIFIVPVFVSWVTFVQLHIFDLQDTFIGFTSPVAIIGMFLVYGFILFWWFSQTRLLKAYNPHDPNSVVKTNKISKRFQTVTLATGILNAFFLPL
jgi:hypothetical protein